MAGRPVHPLKGVSTDKVDGYLRESGVVQYEGSTSKDRWVIRFESGCSSKIPLELPDSGGISFVFTTFGVSLFWRFFVSGVFADVSVLHDLRHEISHCCRPILLLSGGVGVDSEGEARIVVSRHTEDCFDIHDVPEGQGCECVPL